MRTVERRRKVGTSSAESKEEEALPWPDGVLGKVGRKAAVNPTSKVAAIAIELKGEEASRPSLRATKTVGRKAVRRGESAPEGKNAAVDRGWKVGASRGEPKAEEAPTWSDSVAGKLARKAVRSRAGNEDP
jgi:hypothetical protein